VGWELRRGRRVYVREVREGGRVRSVYVGAGEVGEAAAREDEKRRAAKRAARVALAAKPSENQAAAGEGTEFLRSITREEIVERDLARWPPSLHESCAASLWSGACSTAE
jgi:hypothetical protein